VPYSKQDKRPHGAASSWYRDYDTPITLETFSDLTEQLGTFDDAFTDHHNAYSLNDPTVSSVATAPTITTEAQISAIVEAYHLSNSKPPTPAKATAQQPKGKDIAPPSGGRWPRSRYTSSHRQV